MYRKNETHNDVKKNAFSKLLFTLFVISIYAFTPILLLILTFSSMYRFLINILLKCKYRSRFGGLLSGPDNFWLLQDDSKNTISVLLVINYKSSQSLIEALRSRLNSVFMNEKLLSTTGKFLGYSYLIKDSVKIDDCIGELQYEKYSSKVALQNTLSEFGCIELPRHDRALWEVLVGNEEIDWGNKQGNYPILVRFNHCLADGIALLHLLLTTLGDDVQVEDVEEDIDLVQRSVRASIRCMHFALVLIKMSEVILRRLLKVADENVVHGRRLSGQKIYAWKTETRGKYMKIVKTIKSRLRGVGFFDIVATALAFSLKEFLEKNGDKSRDVSAIVPAIPNARQFKNLNIRKTNLDLMNNYSVGEIDLPIRKLNSGKYGVVERLEEVMKRRFALKESYEYQVNYWLLNIVATVLPEQILQPLLKSTHSTFVLSNLPGPQKISVLENNSLEDVVFWLPHQGLTGVGISVFTYDNRFQLGISIDKVYGLTEVDGEKILEGVFKYLECLQFET